MKGYPPSGLVTERTGEPTFADTAWAGDQQIAPLADEAAGGELEEQGRIEATGSVVSSTGKREGGSGNQRTRQCWDDRSECNSRFTVMLSQLKVPPLLQP
jgi:hypothetical protein